METIALRDQNNFSMRVNLCIHGKYRIFAMYACNL